jgi:hypothetical protein
MTAAAAIDAERAVTPDGFTELLRRQLETEISVYPARAWYPSQLGHPCDRHLVWRWTKWQQQRPHDWILQAIFDEGRLHQPHVYTRLEQLGFDIIRESDRPTQWKSGNAVISGRLDGKIRGFRGQRFKPARILEIKTTQGWQFDRLNSIEDIQQAEPHYIREYADQGYLYCFLEGVPQGVLVLKSKGTGLLKAIPFELDFGRAEELLQRVERLQPMVDKGVDPPPIPYDAAVCGRCPFLHLCYPPKDLGAGAGLIDDAALIEDLVVRERLKPARDQYEDLDKGIKARLKRLGMKAGAQAVAGAFLIQVAERAVKEYTVKARTDTIFEITQLAETKPAAESAGRAAREGDPGVEGARQPLPPAAAPLEEKLFGERAEKIAAVDLARAAMKKPLPDPLWKAVCRELCGTEDLEQAELARLDELREVIAGVNRKDVTAIQRINQIAFKHQAGS